MDWSRAKTILILSFLCLNIFLAYQLWEEQKNQGIEGQISQLQIDELKQRLRNAGIHFREEDIPEEMPNISNIRVSIQPLYEHEFSYPVDMVQWEDHTLIVALAKPFQLTEELTDSERSVVLSALVPEMNQYVYDPLISSDGQWVYVQDINGYPVFSSQLQFFLNEEGIIGYHQQSYIPEEIGVSRQVVSAYSALAALLDQRMLVDGEAIVQVEIGYYVEKLDENVQFLVPVWRVIHTQGIHYVNGFTGMVIGEPH